MCSNIIFPAEDFADYFSINALIKKLLLSVSAPWYEAPSVANSQLFSNFTQVIQRTHDLLY